MSCKKLEVSCPPKLLWVALTHNKQGLSPEAPFAFHVDFKAASSARSASSRTQNIQGLDKRSTSPADVNPDSCSNKSEHSARIHADMPPLTSFTVVCRRQAIGNQVNSERTAWFSFMKFKYAVVSFRLLSGLITLPGVTLSLIHI